MAEYRRSAHADYDLKYDVVWITKYRSKVLAGRVAERTRDLIRQICETRGVTIALGSVSPDHIHLPLSAPTDLSPAKRVQDMKGRSSRRIQDEFPETRKRYWGQHLWAGGYCRPSENVAVNSEIWRGFSRGLCAQHVNERSQSELMMATAVDRKT